MKGNASKFHVLISASNNLTVEINEVQIKNSQLKNLYGIIIGNDLKLKIMQILYAEKCHNCRE